MDSLFEAPAPIVSFIPLVSFMLFASIVSLVWFMPFVWFVSDALSFAATSPFYIVMLPETASYWATLTVSVFFPLDFCKNYFTSFWIIFLIFLHVFDFPFFFNKFYKKFLITPWTLFSYSSTPSNNKAKFIDTSFNECWFGVDTLLCSEMAR